jgi:predicted lipid-binding transport protein (Tim44 family)
VDKATVNDQEGTITQDGQTGQEAGTIATSAGTGAMIGGLSHGAKGGLIGAGVGGAVGTAVAMLTRSNDVKLDVGASVEMVIQRDVPLDASRVPNVTNTAASQTYP